MSDEFNFNDYLPTLEKLYGKSVLEQAQKIINGFDKFYGLHESDNSIKGFEMHQKLLTSYEKLQKAKAAHLKK
jgi:ribosomal protein S12 methylthiotransferase accessory factor